MNKEQIEKITSELKKIKWQSIIEYGLSLNDLNISAFRFTKGRAIELAVQVFSDNALIHKDEIHKDFDWIASGLTVELKSQLSASMYNKDGKLKKNFSVKLNNSNGTNKKTSLTENEVCDIIIIARNDGVFFIDKQTTLKYAKAGGDGFSVEVSKDNIFEITSLVTTKNTFKSKLRAKLDAAILDDISDFQSFVHRGNATTSV